MTTILYRDPDLGNIYVPKDCEIGLSLPNHPTKPKLSLREVGIFVAKVRRPIWVHKGVEHFHTEVCNVLTCWVMQLQASGVKVEQARSQLLWYSVTHNERVDAGAAIQANRVFGTSGTTANGVFTALAVATTGFTTKTKTDLSIGSASANVTTNEFTTIGLSRTAGTVSTYTAPASLGAVFSQLLTKSFAVTGTGTAHGGAVFDSTTVSGSNLYVEDTFASDASVVNGDTLTMNVTISN